MEFAELNDEIGADDWLIAGEEISHRKLIRQTPRFNIYKADWYGDVLVYEPIDELSQKNKSNQINQEELSSRLGRLSLDLSCQSPTRHTTSSVDSGSQNDSAYSSISSTPQHHTKNFKSEFEFPSSPSLSSMSSSLSDLSAISYSSELHSNILNCGSATSNLEEKVQYSSDRQKSAKHESKDSYAVILNKDSYKYDCVSEENYVTMTNDSESHRSCWFELNELRLIAHENFMLFMGASFDYKTTDNSTSLVMQMNHPKANSLYNLLHATSATASLSER